MQEASSGSLDRHARVGLYFPEIPQEVSVWGGVTVPVYEYRCQKCGEKYEVVARWRERGQTACPNCGSTEKDRVFGAAAAPGDSRKDSTCRSPFV